MKTVAFVPIKLNNQRTPGKNIKKFDDGSSLITVFLRNLIKVKSFDDVYVFCSNPKIKEYIEEKNIEVNWSFNRTKSTNISFDEVLENDDNKKYSKTKEEGEKRKSHDITVDYIKLGKSLKEIAKERNLALTTIMGHVQQYISEGNEINFKINLEEFFDNDEEKIILKAIDEVGYNKLKDIKEIVPSEITYDAIRAVVLKKVIREVTKNIVK